MMKESLIVGELTVYCQGNNHRAMCELVDNDNGIFTLKVVPQEPGAHQLNIQYDRKHVPGSPFLLRVSPAGMVKAGGPGLAHSLKTVQDAGTFVVDLKDVVPGHCQINVGGRRGKFKLKTRRQHREIHCHYNPRKAGEYIIEILWEGDHIPGSPFTVFKANSQEQLKHFLATGENINQGNVMSSTV